MQYTGTPDTLGLGLLPYDLAGNWRVWNGRIDMGCFEHGSVPYVSVDDPELPSPPERFEVSVYPNPLLIANRTGGVSIEFTLAKKPDAQPVIEIFNIRGQKVKSIRLDESNNNLISKSRLKKDVKQNGELYSTLWLGEDDNNKSLASGVYIIQITADKMKVTAKLTIMK